MNSMLPHWHRILPHFTTHNNKNNHTIYLSTTTRQQLSYDVCEFFDQKNRFNFLCLTAPRQKVEKKNYFPHMSTQETNPKLIAKAAKVRTYIFLLVSDI